VEVTPDQVPQASMYDSQAVGRGGGAKIVPIHHGYPETSKTCVPRDAGSLNACAHNEQVESRVSKAREVALHAGPSPDIEASMRVKVPPRDLVPEG
jgi:hypothetical protein